MLLAFSSVVVLKEGRRRRRKRWKRWKSTHTRPSMKGRRGLGPPRPAPPRGWWVAWGLTNSEGRRGHVHVMKRMRVGLGCCSQSSREGKVSLPVAGFVARPPVCRLCGWWRCGWWCKLERDAMGLDGRGLRTLLPVAVVSVFALPPLLPLLPFITLHSKLARTTTRTVTKRERRESTCFRAEPAMRWKQSKVRVKRGQDSLFGWGKNLPPLSRKHKHNHEME